MPLTEMLNRAIAAGPCAVMDCYDHQATDPFDFGAGDIYGKPEPLAIISDFLRAPLLEVLRERSVRTELCPNLAAAMGVQTLCVVINCEFFGPSTAPTLKLNSH